MGNKVLALPAEAPERKGPPVRQDAFAMVNDVSDEVRAQAMSHAERRAAAARAAAKDKRPKGTFDLPLALLADLEALSEQESVSRSNLAELALRRLLADVAAGRLDLAELKIPTRSTRYWWELKMPADSEEK